MRRFNTILLAVALAVTAAAQTIAGGGTKESETKSITVSGNSINFLDALGTTVDGFEMIVNGSPSTVAVTISACWTSGTCVQVTSSTSITNVVLPAVSTNGPPSYWKVSGSWTGGSSPSLTFNRIAGVGGGGIGGGTVTVVQPTGTNLHVVVDNTQQQYVGSITSTQCVTAPVGGAGSAVLTTTGAGWTGTLNFSYSADAVNFQSLSMFAIPVGTTASVTSATANGTWAQSVSGMTTVEVCGSGVTGGTVTVTWTVSQAAFAFPGGLVNGSGNELVTIIGYANAAATTGLAPVGQFINASGAAISVKGGSGNLYGFALSNGTAAVCIVEFFNTASVPTLGTTAVYAAFILPANTLESGPVVVPVTPAPFLSFNTGIGFAAVTAENGSTTCSVTGEVLYK